MLCGDQIKVWRIPQDGMAEDLCKCSAELSGHTKRLGHCEWHPTADNILLSVAYDLKVTKTATTTTIKLKTYKRRLSQLYNKTCKKSCKTCTTVAALISIAANDGVPSSFIAALCCMLQLVLCFKF